MTITLGSILQTTVTWQVGSNTTQLQNVYWYEVTQQAVELIDNPGILQIWAQQFCETVLIPQAAMITGGFSVASVRVDNRTNNIDFTNHIPLGDINGLVAGEYMPLFTAWSFRLERTTKETRNGYKRLPGVPESLVNNGVSTVSPAVYDDVTDGLSSVVSSVGTGGDYGQECVPVIVRRDGTGLITAHQRVYAATFLGVSTQNTRKR